MGFRVIGGVQPFVLAFPDAGVADETVTAEATVAEDPGVLAGVLGFVDASVDDVIGSAEAILIGDLTLAFLDPADGLDEGAVYSYVTHASEANWTDAANTSANHDDDYPLNVAAPGVLGGTTRFAYHLFDLTGLDELNQEGSTISFEVTTGTTLISLVTLDVEVYASASNPGVYGSTWNAPPSEGTWIFSDNFTQSLIGSTTVNFSLDPDDCHGNFVMLKWGMAGLIDNSTTLTDSEEWEYT